MEYGKGWFKKRERLFAQLAKKEDVCAQIDSVFFRMGSPDAGWIDVEVFVNGKRKYMTYFGNFPDPFPNIKNWLESIAKGQTLQHALLVDLEGAEDYYCYEMLRNSNDGNAVGLFYIYDSGTDTIPVKAVVNTRELVTAMYLAVLNLASNCYNSLYSNFKDEWYYDGLQLRKDNWSFYNSMKSPLLDWYLHAKEKYNINMKFKKHPLIKETVSMWCDYGDALFWGRGTDNHAGCCGDAESFFTDTCGEIDLSGIKGLQEWYTEWEEAPRTKGDDDGPLSKGWKERGWQFALQVREILPHNIDLFYYNWYPAVDVPQDNEYQFPERIPMIVPHYS